MDNSEGEGSHAPTSKPVTSSNLDTLRHIKDREIA
jgi:hypothetical protein